MEIPLLLALAFVLALFYWAWIASPRSIQTGREQLLRELGQVSGASLFPVDPRRMLGDWGGNLHPVRSGCPEGLHRQSRKDCPDS